MKKWYEVSSIKELRELGNVHDIAPAIAKSKSFAIAIYADSYKELFEIIEKMRSFVGMNKETEQKREVKIEAKELVFALVEKEVPIRKQKTVIDALIKKQTEIDEQRQNEKQQGEKL